MPVNSKYADPLESPELQELAHIFSRLECQILAFVRDVMELENRRGAPPENTQACSRLEKTRQALHEVHVGNLPVLRGVPQGRRASARLDRCWQCSPRLVQVGI